MPSARFLRAIENGGFSWLLLLATGIGAAACGGDARAAGAGRAAHGAATGGGGAGPNGGSGGSLGPVDNAANPAGMMMPLPVGSGGQGPGAAPVTNSSRDPISLDQCGTTNAANLSAADIQKLQAPGGSAGNMKWLYPYEGTVFPRGTLAPWLMWDPAAADAVYLHIRSKAFEYKGCLKPSAAGRLELAQDVWDSAGQQTYGRDDAYTVELSVLSGGQVTGPIVLHFIIAQATVKGSIYYNSYNSKLGNGEDGMVLRIPPGGSAAPYITTKCNGCHAVSADGSRMLTQSIKPELTETFKLMAGGAANPPAAMAGMRGGFGAFYPDGSKYLATSVVIDVGRTQNDPLDAMLYDSNNGQVVPNVGIPTGALMPTFSPDGTRLVFNDYAIGMGQGLAIMDYDVRTDTATNYEMLTQDSGALRPGWPFMLPDNRGVVFVRTDSLDFSGNGAGITMPQPGVFGAPPDLTTVGFAPFSELSIADVASGKVTLLARAMGYDTPDDAANDKTYLPFGADELHHNYFPTLSPVAAGGYFWVFFDSLRHYGNQGEMRQLWGTALDIDARGDYTSDPSHPAFYLTGQELGTGNHRAFAALDPCKQDGDDCTSGIDCCGGSCNIPDGGGEFSSEQHGTCGPKKHSCAQRDERCASNADCCPPQMGESPSSCIAGYCAFVPPVD